MATIEVRKGSDLFFSAKNRFLFHYQGLFRDYYDYMRKFPYIDIVSTIDSSLSSGRITRFSFLCPSLCWRLYHRTVLFACCSLAPDLRGGV